MLTVACVFVAGHVPFTVEYVEKLYWMAKRHVRTTFTFVCLTDRPHLMPQGVVPIKIEPPGELKGWWRKIELFNPAHGLHGRVLYLDLDVLLVADLAPIINYRAEFALVPDGAPGFRPSNKQTIKRFNSSVMVWNSGDNAHLFTDWTPKVAHRLWGDQDWIGERCFTADVMPAEWFPRLSEVQPPWPEAAKVVLAKKPKNHIAAEQFPWFREWWG